MFYSWYIILGIIELMNFPPSAYLSILIKHRMHNVCFLSGEDGGSRADPPWYNDHYTTLTTGIGSGQTIAGGLQAIVVPFGEKVFPVTTTANGFATTVAGELGQVGFLNF